MPAHELPRGSAGRRNRSARQRQGVKLFLMTMPLLLATVLFSYVPLAGWSIAFFDYKLGLSLFEVPGRGDTLPTPLCRWTATASRPATRTAACSTGY
jgi:hypothetical protein